MIRLNRELERGQEGYGSLRKGAANYLDVNGVTIAKDPVPDVDLLLRMERAEKVKLDKKAKVDAQVGKPNFDLNLHKIMHCSNSEKNSMGANPGWERGSGARNKVGDRSHRPRKTTPHCGERSSECGTSEKDS